MLVKTPINSVGAKVPIHLEKAIKTDCPAVLVLLNNIVKNRMDIAAFYKKAEY